jgi:hypothetical protein
MEITADSHNGAVTQNHDQSMLSVNFSVMKIRNNTVPNPRPLLLLLLDSLIRSPPHFSLSALVQRPKAWVCGLSLRQELGLGDNLDINHVSRGPLNRSLRGACSWTC